MSSDKTGEQENQANIGRDRDTCDLVLGSNLHSYVDLKPKMFMCQILDASQTIEDLHSEIKALTIRAMEDCKEKPLGQLWQF